MVFLSLAFAAMYVCSAPLRQSANAAIESEAIATARDIAVAEVTCRAQYGRLAELQELIELGLLPKDFIRSRAKGAYAFRIDLDPNGESFLVHARPQPSWTRHRFFSVDELATLRWNESTEAGRGSNIVKPN